MTSTACVRPLKLSRWPYGQSKSASGAEVVRGIFERKDVHVDALALGDLLERQHLVRLEDYGRRGAWFHDAIEPQVVIGRLNGRRSGPGALAPLPWCQAVLFDRERNQVVKGASLALPLEFPAEQMELVAREMQLKLQRSHLANS